MTATGGKRLRALSDQLAALDLVVITQRDEDGQVLLRELQRTRAAVRHVWPVPERLPLQADVVFCDLTPNLAHQLPWLPGEAAAALVVIVPDGGAADLLTLRDCAPQGVLGKPIAPAGVLPALVTAWEQFQYEKRLRSRIDKLDETLRAMRNVERAKAILMHARHIDEDQAFQFLRRQAMERRISIGRLAETVIASQDLLG